MRLRDVWNQQADEWTRFVRDPAGDVANPVYNLPRFLELLPKPGRATLDLGCGEGRTARELAALGYSVVGLDSSPAMVAAALAAGSEAVVGDATALPFADSEFDLVVAFMSLQDIDELERAISEAARVLEPSGRFCFAVPHPIASCGRFASQEPDAAFAVSRSYFERCRRDDIIERDGFRVSFSAEDRPFSVYAAALEGAGLLSETLREPPASDAMVEQRPSYERWQRVPLFLHVRARKR